MVKDKSTATYEGLLLVIREEDLEDGTRLASVRAPPVEELPASFHSLSTTASLHGDFFLNRLVYTNYRGKVNKLFTIKDAMVKQR